MKDKVTKTLVRVMALGTFVVVLDNTIMNVSISSLVADLNTTVSGVQAAISLNALMMAAFVLMGGKMADIIGMKKTFIGGAMIYVVGSLLASFSNNLTVFILGWCAIQGFGAAMMLPNVTTIVRANVAQNSRAAAFGLIAGINALGTAVGPLLGGFLTTYFSWRWAFRLEVAILLVVLLMSKVIPKDKLLDKVRPQLDKVGVLWQASAMIFLVVGTLAISDYGLLMAKQPLMIGDIEFAPFGLSIVPILFALGILCLMMFVNHEGKMVEKAKNVLVDLKLFSISKFVNGLSIRFIQVALVAGTTFSVPLFLQVTFGLSAFETGLILMGLTAGLLITSIGASRGMTSMTPKSKVEKGFLISIVGLFIMGIYVYFGENPIGMVPGIFVYGLGLGLITSQIVNVIMSTVTSKQTAEASGVTSTLETLGSSVGTALIGTIIVVALTTGVGRLVESSEVLPTEIKTEVTQNMSASIEIVSNEVLSDTITLDNEIEDEIVRIYDEARANAFIISILFMALSSLIAYILSRKLPKEMVAVADLA